MLSWRRLSNFERELKCSTLGAKEITKEAGDTDVLKVFKLLREEIHELTYDMTRENINNGFSGVLESVRWVARLLL